MIKKSTDSNESSPSLNQSEIFLTSEGDGWFSRNSTIVSSRTNHFEIETIKRILKDQADQISSILEIGCGSGIKLQNLCKYFDASGSGVDPSSAAIYNGKVNLVDLDLSVALASSLPFESQRFDLVYFGFCLYLVDRGDIFRAISEADRVLKSGGFLAIVDFDPMYRHKRAYHHKENVFTYKTAYSDFFTVSGHYYLVAKESFSHSANSFTRDSDERVSVSVLYKEPDAYAQRDVHR